jgi:hypothetical protein
MVLDEGGVLGESGCGVGWGGAAGVAPGMVLRCCGVDGRRREQGGRDEEEEDHQVDPLLHTNDHQRAAS